MAALTSEMVANFFTAFRVSSAMLSAADGDMVFDEDDFLFSGDPFFPDAEGAPEFCIFDEVFFTVFSAMKKSSGKNCYLPLQQTAMMNLTDCYIITFVLIFAYIRALW
jgi:hypothetical protein